MSSYWDELHKRASINLICALDAEIIAKQQTMLIACDREFPEVFRPKIAQIVQNDSMELPTGRLEKNIENYKHTRQSKLIVSLQILWKDIALSSTPTRFGVLLDDPSWALAAREIWDKENEDFEVKKQGEKR